MFHFYPRPPRGGRQVANHRIADLEKFLSTPSARRATSFWPCHQSFCTNFYPRPPRGGRLFASTLFPEGVVFLSTPSARRATNGTSILQTNVLFLSTPSARRATFEVVTAPIRYFISIHALREEGDHQRRFCANQTGISIHALREEGDRGVNIQDNITAISIHALREEGDG